MRLGFRIFSLAADAQRGEAASFALRLWFLIFSNTFVAVAYYLP